MLDGLNHVKDRLDGTLSYRWSCRMGICGSCGMNVNGEPKLTCATFLADYAPGPIRVEPLRNFPVIRDLIVDIGDFMQKLVRVKPWIVRTAEKPLVGRRVPADAGATGRVQAVQHVHQLHAVLRGVPDLRSGSQVHRARRRSRSPSATTSTAATRARRIAWQVLSEHEGIWGCTFVGECTKVCPKHVDPAGAIQRYKLTAAMDSMKAFFMPRGA